MTTAQQWKTWILVFAILLLVGAVYNLASLGWYNHDAVFPFSSLLIGLMFLVASILGIRATMVHHPDAAKRYYVALIVATLFALILNVVYLIVAYSSFDKVCKASCEGVDQTTCESVCDVAKHAVVIGVSVGLAISFACNIGCVLCARSYWKALEQEGGRIPY
eukprot:TRINITY_DN142_c0_g1_i2.p1 TRINITY_DN142_c0_g1~~TRINITY_DN142_c0_g1_i2.p1  ORF type:complete len:163 (-),score=41.73 TRINITY_DN142_c0_g1_i2:89-577(-)